ncbi:unnamed protein product [Cuscuta campestris]|uniref:Uncharacterized protein n=1 Tax=Cuscuta campestris TaxID=132261 RepID=A0A484LCD8_9ASTE|nr:unnamed protein product [Cuscuta campestris]
MDPHYLTRSPRQFTANTHKYLASYILCCHGHQRTPSIDDDFLMLSIGGPFPYFSIYPKKQWPIFTNMEEKIEKWAKRYFVIKFPEHSPLDLPFEVLRSSLSRTPFSKSSLDQKPFNEMKGDTSVIDHEDVHTASLFRLASFHFPRDDPVIPHFKGKQIVAASVTTKGSQNTYPTAKRIEKGPSVPKALETTIPKTPGIPEAFVTPLAGEVSFQAATINPTGLVLKRLTGTKKHSSLTLSSSCNRKGPGILSPGSLPQRKRSNHIPLDDAQSKNPLDAELGPSPSGVKLPDSDQVQKGVVATANPPEPFLGFPGHPRPAGDVVFDELPLSMRFDAWEKREPWHLPQFHHTKGLPHLPRSTSIW